MKRILTVIFLMIMCLPITTYAEDLPIGYWNIAEPYRYLTFATDGGSFIKALEKPIGEYVSLESYVPTKKATYLTDGIQPPEQKRIVYMV